MGLCRLLDGIPRRRRSSRQFSMHSLLGRRMGHESPLHLERQTNGTPTLSALAQATLERALEGLPTPRQFHCGTVE